MDTRRTRILILAMLCSALLCYLSMYALVRTKANVSTQAPLFSPKQTFSGQIFPTRTLRFVNVNMTRRTAVTSSVKQAINASTNQITDADRPRFKPLATHAVHRSYDVIEALNATNDDFLKPYKRLCENVEVPDVLKNSTKPLCPCIPTGLTGRTRPSLGAPSWQELEAAHPDVAQGVWKPASCSPRQRACLLLPYRDRDEHLRMWLNYMLPFMKKQNVNFHIFVAEQDAGSRFNRGMMINVAFTQAQKDGVHCDCVIIHDVDVLPEDDRNMYFCDELPRHLAVARNVDHYRLPYYSFLGAAVAVRGDQFERVNGFSNLYFGWGSEDDDLYERFTKIGNLPVRRYPEYIARYFMFPHPAQPENEGRWSLVRNWRSRWNTDGLNDVLHKCDVSSVQKRKLFTHIQVKVTESKVTAASVV